MNAIQSKKESQYAKKNVVRLAGGTGFANHFVNDGLDTFSLRAGCRRCWCAAY
jgi:hypothetical protein